jgi:isopentenyl phosphate kinase
MKTKQTPYFDKKTFNQSGEMLILREPNELVATVHGDHGFAHLIAAAPDMLEALEAVLQDFSALNVQQEITKRQVMDAIKKAKGE